MSKDRKKTSLPHKIRTQGDEEAMRIQIPNELAEDIADTARTGYQREGRGLTIVAVSPSEDDISDDIMHVEVNQFYIPTRRLRYVRPAIPYLSDEEYEEVIQMVEDVYNPITQFVVLLSMGDNLFWYIGEHDIQFVSTA
jgi:hypothetical protein